MRMIIRQASSSPLRRLKRMSGTSRPLPPPCAAVRMRQAGQGEDRRPEQVEAAALEADPVADRIVDDPHRGDLPARVARAAVRRRPPRRASRRRDSRVVRPSSRARLGRGEPAAVLEHEQQILDDSVAQSVGRARRCRHKRRRPAGLIDADIALGADLAADPVPGHRVGAQIIAVAVHPHVAAGGDDVGLLS